VRYHHRIIQRLRYLLLVAALLFATEAARADQITAFSFEGTLATSFGSQSSVCGEFTVDFTTLAVTVLVF
jgi:hypothetical protein